MQLIFLKVKTLLNNAFKSAYKKKKKWNPTSDVHFIELAINSNYHGNIVS